MVTMVAMVEMVVGSDGGRRMVVWVVYAWELSDGDVGGGGDVGGRGDGGGGSGSKDGSHGRWQCW